MAFGWLAVSRIGDKGRLETLVCSAHAWACMLEAVVVVVVVVLGCGEDGVVNWVLNNPWCELK